jgi:hypothetical protein
MNIRQPEEVGRDHPTYPHLRNTIVEAASGPLRHSDKKQNQRSALCECRVPNEEMSFEARDKSWGADQTETGYLRLV